MTVSSVLINPSDIKGIIKYSQITNGQVYAFYKPTPQKPHAVNVISNKTLKHIIKEYPTGKLYLQIYKLLIITPQE